VQVFSKKSSTNFFDEDWLVLVVDDVSFLDVWKGDEDGQSVEVSAGLMIIRKVRGMFREGASKFFMKDKGHAVHLSLV